MTYNKTSWQDRQVPKPLTFSFPLVDNGDGTTTLVPAEGTPTQAGTPINAANLNNLENGVANVDSRLTTVEGAYLNKTGDTMTGTLTVPTVTAPASTDLWVKPSSGKVVNIGTSASADGVTINGSWIQNNFNTGNLTLSSGAGAGLLILQSPTTAIRMLIGSDGLRVANLAYNGYMPVFASAFTVTSDRNMKKNIEPFTENAENLVNTTKVYEYNLNTELDGELKHIGLIMQESPVEVVEPSGTGVDLYAMVGVLWKAVQELSAKVQALTPSQTTTQSTT